MSQTLHGAFGGMFIWLASRVDGEFRRMGVVSALAIAYSGSHSDKGQVNYSSLLISMAS